MIRNGKRSNTLFMELNDYILKYPKVSLKYEIVGEWKGVEERVETRCKSCGLSWNAIPYNLAKEKAKCPYCEGAKTKYDTLYLSNLCKINGFELLSKCNTVEDIVKVKHLKCGTIFEKKVNVLVRHFSCPACRINSQGEEKIRLTLEKYNIDYKKEVTFKGLKGLKGGSLRFDFGIYNNGELLFLLEYDGEQHEHEITRQAGSGYIMDYKTTKKHDLIKESYCKDNNIDLHRITYHNRRTVSKILTQLLIDYKLIPSQANES